MDEYMYCAFQNEIVAMLKRFFEFIFCSSHVEMKDFVANRNV